MTRLCFTAESGDENERLDRFLAEKQDILTRSRLEKLSSRGDILVNGISKLKSYRLKSGDIIEVAFDDNPPQIAVKPKHLTVEIVYEDADLLVVNKERGMLTHPSDAGEDNTLVNALLFHCGRLPEAEDPARPGIVHRIDRDTSGLLVAAKTTAAFEGLAQQVNAHTMLRRYEGIVHGRLQNTTGVIDAAIARHPVRRTIYRVSENGRRAVTRYRVAERFGKFTLAEFELETGRTHQIRVHMAHMGHPVAGDTVYGTARTAALPGGQCLHAKTLGFTHPGTGEWLEFSAGLPRYFTDFLEKLRREESF